jgi:phosphoglycerate dehydrogenase-like enzyme
MSKPKLLVLNRTCLDVIEEFRDWVESEGLELHKNTNVAKDVLENLIPLSQEADGVVGPMYCPITPDFFERLPRLKVLSLASSGYDGITDPEAATRRGVVLTSAPVAEGAEVVADMAWGLMLSIARRIPQHHHNLRQGIHTRALTGTVYEKTLGILGLGNIGKRVIQRATGFRMKVLAHDVRPDHDFARKHGVELVGFEELLARSDFISIHLRLNTETRGIVGARELSRMKPGAYLINTARDALVDETALADALEQGLLSGAATDEAPRQEAERLLANPNYICTPHIGNRAIEGVRAVTRCALRNAMDVLQGKRPEYVLNPKVYENGLHSLAGRESHR